MKVKLNKIDLQSYKLYLDVLRGEKVFGGRGEKKLLFQ